MKLTLFWIARSEVPGLAFLELEVSSLIVSLTRKPRGLAWYFFSFSNVSYNPHENRLEMSHKSVLLSIKPIWVLDYY